MKFDLIVVNTPKLSCKQLQITCSCKWSGYILVDFYWWIAHVTIGIFLLCCFTSSLMKKINGKLLNMMKQTFNHGRLRIIIVRGFFNHKCCNTLPLISPLGSTKTSPRKLEKKKLKKITILLIHYLEWQMKEQSFFKHICTQKNENFHKMCFFFLTSMGVFFWRTIEANNVKEIGKF